MHKSTRYSPEVRKRAVRMVFEHQGEHKSQWAAIFRPLANQSSAFLTGGNNVRCSQTRNLLETLAIEWCKSAVPPQGLPVGGELMFTLRPGVDRNPGIGLAIGSYPVSQSPRSAPRPLRKA